MSIFKSCDIRGVYGEDLTEAIMADIGRGMVSIMRRGLDRPRVVVGGDIRRSTRPLQEALIDGMVRSGAHVIDIGRVPTPVFYFAFRMIPGDGCAMVTASHNPPRFNGLKLCLSHRPVSVGEIEQLRHTIEAKDFARGVGRHEQLDVNADYEAWLAGQFPEPLPLKMVVDAGGGSWSEMAPRALRRTGFDVVPLFCDPDPDLGVRNPNPLPEYLGELGRTVVATGCRLGVAFDGDGDRVVFVDEAGDPIPGDIAGAVFSRWLLGAHPGEKVVYEVNCSQALAEAITEAGGTALMERAGHAFMKQRMINERALFGVEISGHFFHRVLGGGDDGLYSGIMMGRILHETGSNLSDLVAGVPRYYSTPVVRLPRSTAEAERLVEAIAANAREGEVSRLDGVRVQYEGGWALARVSVTEDVISMRFEARSREFLHEILDMFLGFDRELKQEVSEMLEAHKQL